MTLRNKNIKFEFKDIGLTADVHSHILPGVDDGSPSLKESSAIIAVMREAGVNRFTFTPHVSCGLFNNSTQTLRDRFDAFLDELPSELTSGATFQLAAEYMVDDFFYEMIAAASRDESMEKPLTFPDKSILIEMSYMSRSPQILDSIFALVQDGYKPILAHPERYCFYFGEGQKDSFPLFCSGTPLRKAADRFGVQLPNPVKSLVELEKIVSMGCRLQLNVQSLTGSYGSASLDNLKYMLDHDLYSFVGTDIHAAAQFSHYRDLDITPAQLERVRALAANNLKLF